MKALVAYCLLSLAFLSGCATPAVTVSPKPDIRPVAQSNKAIQVSSKKIRSYSDHTLKLNQDIQSNLDSGLNALDKLLAR